MTETATVRKQKETGTRPPGMTGDFRFHEPLTRLHEAPEALVRVEWGGENTQSSDSEFRETR